MENSIAGVKSVSLAVGTVLSNLDVNKGQVVFEPVEELYTKKDVYDILRQYDWYVHGYDVSEEMGNSKDESFKFADYIADKLKDDDCWEGVDRFMKIGEYNE